MSRQIIKSFQRWILSLVCLGALGLGGGVASAWAQAGPVTLAALHVELWPEFDRPAMLVLVTGQLDPGVALPAQVTVRLPAASGGPYAVADRPAGGNLVDVPYTSTVSGDQILVTFRADAADFRLEYYDPALTLAGPARTYTFTWTTDYAVPALSIRVQEPLGATQLTGIPALTPAGAGPYGLNYYTLNLGALTPGQTATLHLAYTKASAALSAEGLGVGTPTPAPALALPLAPPTPTAPSPWLWAGLAVGLLLFGGAMYWLGQRAPARPKGKQGRPRRRAHPRELEDSPSMATATASAPVGFCTQCGQPLQPGDGFCRKCGTPARP